MQLKNYFSVKIGVAHFCASQNMLLMFMMQMMEIRNMCMAIGLCRSYLRKLTVLYNKVRI